jgi:heme exporter protein B
VFSGILAFGRAYQLEAENNAFEGLLLIAESRGAIFMGKMLGAAAVMLVIEVVVIPLMAVLFNLDVLGHLPVLLVVCILGTLGYAAIGALYGALTMSFRAREVLLPLLVLPVTVPVILGAVRATTIALSPSLDGLRNWLEVLVAFDVVFITLGLLTFEYAVGE